ncbi:hypothetical protein KEJ13_04330 [Candidatus Bathyarchaeota archaeon]|nr:hypothetical protein [Candidatus Bathyarchaeota archaeon]
MSSLDEIKTNLERLFKDPILNILLKNSNLTEIQLETLIIESISEISYVEKINYTLKGLIRPKKVTRGSFHRTLQQAKKNIISALFTILLLIYLGSLDESFLNDFKLLAKRLKEYLSLPKTISLHGSEKAFEEIEEELLNAFKGFLEVKT